MTKEIFTLPVPATSLLKSPEFHERPGRISEIVCEYEGNVQGQFVRLSLSFKNRFGVRITNAFACDIEMLSMTYAKVVDLGETNWLKAIKSNVVANMGVDEGLLHLGIYFDDDCLYEFVCGSFHSQKTYFDAGDVPIGTRREE